jgi:hypothetical protein
VHLVGFDLSSYTRQKHLGCRLAPVPNASEQGQRIGVHGAFEELVLEEGPDLFESFVFGPGSDGSRLFVGLDVDKASVFEESWILGERVKL